MEFAKYVDVFTEKINLAFGIGAALFAALFGQFWGGVLGFLVLNKVSPLSRHKFQKRSDSCA